jgi:hypothetical protein
MDGNGKKISWPNIGALLTAGTGAQQILAVCKLVGPGLGFIAARGDILLHPLPRPVTRPVLNAMRVR